MSEHSMDHTRLQEALADYAHDGWSRWMSYLFARCEANADGSFTILREDVNHWQRQMVTLYENLTNTEQASDRLEADRILSAIQHSGFEVRVVDWND